MKSYSRMEQWHELPVILREHGVDLRLGLIDEGDAAYKAEAANELEFSDEDSDDEESRTK